MFLLAVHGSVNIPQYSNHLRNYIFKSPPSKKMFHNHHLKYIFKPHLCKDPRCFSTVGCFSTEPLRWCIHRWGDLWAVNGRVRPGLAVKRRFVGQEVLGRFDGWYQWQANFTIIEMVSNGWGCSAWGSKWLGIPMVVVGNPPQGIISRWNN